ncbi:hypothetical protein F3Y22_tig00116995pilonHSYRG00009 [Hibiscus syriacus]|uniref:Glutaredoxin domain-containing protein n=1 Tax=Hibiscus syriacus TaxID=106335 RepID=A0A6A2WS63_HIBSY|nr:hypothetical protein F3Y22_tig00116995pilonHSYRG00009 [Hibiscus syriacus]
MDEGFFKKCICKNGGENGGEAKRTAVSGDQDGGDFVVVEIEKSNEEKEETKPPGEEKEESTSNSIKIPETKGIQEYNDKDIKPQAPFPKLDPPPSPPKVERSQSLSIAETIPSVDKYINDRSNSLSAATVRSLSSLKEENNDLVVKDDLLNFEVTEFKIREVKVIFFREKGLVYVEINIDVFPKREKELNKRTGSSETPQIFFNDKWFGGLAALNELKESGEYEAKLKELVGERCPEGAPEFAYSRSVA